MEMRLLIVEDQQELAETLGKALERHGFAVDLAFDGEDGLFRAGLTDYDLIILDLNLPDIDGLEVCRRLRERQCRAAVLMLTARGKVTDRVAGLDVGADDYLVKPFALEELLARVRALLRRATARRQTTVRVGRLELDPARHYAAYAGRSIELTRREFAVLEYLARRSPDVISAEDLLEHVWDDEANPFTNTMRVHIANLRRKLRDVSGDPLIDTIVGKGYKLCAR